MTKLIKIFMVYRQLENLCKSNRKVYEKLHSFRGFRFVKFFIFFFNKNNFENRCRTCHTKKYKTEPVSGVRGVVSSLYFLHFFSLSVRFHSENSRPTHGSRSPTATVNYNIISVMRILSVIDDNPRARTERNYNLRIRFRSVSHVCEDNNRSLRRKRDSSTLEHKYLMFSPILPGVSW